ncbi:RecF/RecN/SMC [Polychytrium aggregatum]|uniref:RecF/RecN/SMC n=1 Tax=Polychytrium aggregatum TaxID=110093 RepID=UPI0022FE1E34|nr:RecF/RecN/SMC [Polychytrium aggregatum]KAI9206146.1 RecF/RecN/SMC [Polychytrium aggregatum]
MHIQEVIIDGFKSYANRTVISGWDPEFNAITGLNGSGKSNILDSICFVLGITTLSHVRASSLQDLIYKRGQAGVTKASVTIVFNNDDRNASPPGYEDHRTISVTRQILIGGKNKYIINGHSVQVQQVSRMFQSVQLNVNNPHFLIMQGKITKVLNMKPPEILAMVEEAAGTRMFEEGKEKAIKNMAKKDAKLAEINDLLATEIGPKLDSLREKKRVLVEFQKIDKELGDLKRLIVAHEYHQCQTKLARSNEFLIDSTSNIASLENDIDTMAEEIRKIEQLLAENAAEQQRDERVEQLDETVKEYAKAIVKLQTQSELKARSIQEETGNRDSLNETKNELLASLEEAQSKFKELSQKFEATSLAHANKVKEVENLENLLQTLTTGISASEGHENGYMDQLRVAKADLSNTVAEIEEIKIKISHTEKELKTLEGSMGSASKENRQLVQSFEQTQARVKKSQELLAKLEWDPEKQQKLAAKQSQLRATLNQLRKTYDNLLMNELAGFQLQFTDPYKGFDRSKVRGLVANLMRLSEDQYEYALALEVAAGGKLRNIVVETEQIGAQLLSGKHFQKRETLIPLNKIHSNPAAPEKVRTAKNLAPGKVSLALDMIEFEQDLQKAMEYVFGSTLICKDADSAKTTTFNDRVRLRSVTMDGDVYEATGTLSGGFRSSTTSQLIKVFESMKLLDQIEKLQAELDEVCSQLEALMQTASDYSQAKRQLELDEYQMKLVNEQIESSRYAKIASQVDSLKQELQDYRQNLKESSSKKSEFAEKIQYLEKEMSELSEHRNEKVLSLKKKVKEGRAEIVKNAPATKKMQMSLDILKEEANQIELQIAQVEERIHETTKLLGIYLAEEQNQRQKIERVKRDLDASTEELETAKAKIAAADANGKKLQKEKKLIMDSTEEKRRELQRIKQEISRFNTEKKESSLTIQNLEREHAWIQDQRSLFGQPGSVFDFTRYNVAECKKRARQLEEGQQSLSRTLDPSAAESFTRVEKQELALKQRLATVKRDKRKIDETILSLETYKTEALQKTWEKVNRDFGAIFGELLPGNDAKLEPPEGQDITEGLEVKVALGGVWKQSLTELSGGQRSLVALALILSLLRFKPAPMYILDEVDAALDLSHTQNIGQLLKTRFKGSQFIIVSLKDGMFSNANVLFRTRFREGVSVVERTAQKAAALARQRTHATPLS